MATGFSMWPPPQPTPNAQRIFSESNAYAGSMDLSPKSTPFDPGSRASFATPKNSNTPMNITMKRPSATPTPFGRTEHAYGRCLQCNHLIQQSRELANRVRELEKQEEGPSREELETEIRTLQKQIAVSQHEASQREGYCSHGNPWPSCEKAKKEKDMKNLEAYTDKVTSELFRLRNERRESGKPRPQSRERRRSESRGKRRSPSRERRRSLSKQQRRSPSRERRRHSGSRRRRSGSRRRRSGSRRRRSGSRRRSASSSSSSRSAAFSVSWRAKAVREKWDDADKQIQEMREQHELELNEAQQKQNAQTEEMQAQISALKEQHATEMSQKGEERQAEIAALQEQHAGEMATVQEEGEKEIACSLLKVSQAQDLLQVLQFELDAMKKRAEVTERKHKLAISKNSDKAEKEVKILKEKHAEEISKMTQRQDDMRESFRREGESAKAFAIERDQLCAMHDAEMEEYKRESSDLKSQIDELTQQLSKAGAHDIDTMRAEMDSLKEMHANEVALLEQRMTEMRKAFQKEVDDVKAELKERCDENLEMKNANSDDNKVAEIEELRLAHQEEISKLTIQIRSCFKKEFDDTKNELEETKKKLEECMANQSAGEFVVLPEPTTAAFDELQLKNEGLVEKATELQKEITKLKGETRRMEVMKIELAGARSEIRKLQENSFIPSRSNDTSKMSEEIRTLKGRLASSFIEIETLQQTASKQQHEIRASSARLQQAEGEVAKLKKLNQELEELAADWNRVSECLDAKEQEVEILKTTLASVTGTPELEEKLARKSKQLSRLQALLGEEFESDSATIEHTEEPVGVDADADGCTPYIIRDGFTLVAPGA